MNDRRSKMSTPTAGTCQWLLRHREWKRWLSARGGLMWIKGKPGSGKSTLLWYAEQELKNTTVKKKDIVLSFFFHGRGEQLQRSPLGMYRALLHQLLKQEPASLSHLVEAFQHQAAGKDNEDIAWNRDIGNLGNFLENAIYTILASRTVWLFVDALDECGREGAGDVLQRFNRLGRPGLFICISCRHYPLHHWDGGFEVTVEEQNKADILRYAQSQLSGLEGKTSFSVPDVISTRSTGLFIWARLAVERLRNIDVEFWGDAVEEDIRRVIESIPHDLEDLYTGIVREVGKIPAALKMLRWISCAQRPLLLDELRWVFIVDPDAHANHQFFSLSECEATAMRDARCPQSDRDMEAMVKAFSRGLLETVGSASGRIVVQFIHQTVMDFFRQGGILLLDDDNKESTEDAVDAAHDHLLRTCIAFLKMHEAGRQRDLDPNVPFLVYATQFWVEHASSSRKGQVRLLEYLNWPSDPFVKYWEEYYKTLEKHLTGPDCPPPGIELVHVLARHGLVAPLSTIVERTEKPNLDAADSLDRTPLMYAAERGQISVVKTLIRAGARTQAADCIGATPLHWAALRGHTEIMTLLLENGAKSGARVKGRCTPLAWALEGGSEAGVKLLLENCDVELLDAEYILPHTAKKSRFTMDDFVQASVDFYFVGDAGNIFERSPPGGLSSSALSRIASTCPRWGSCQEYQVA
ncbi:hypothetical protein VTI28DRAFT_7444 [Corynascus sepedonium]